MGGEVSLLTDEAEIPSEEKANKLPGAPASTFHDDGMSTARNDNAETPGKQLPPDDRMPQNVVDKAVKAELPEDDSALAQYFLHRYESSFVPSREDFETLQIYLGEKVAGRKLWRVINRQLRRQYKIESGPIRVRLTLGYLQAVVALSLIGAGVFAIVERLTPVAVTIFGVGIAAVGVIGYLRSTRDR